ncbi:hypothetical protein [Oxynema aestuarii]|uniref:Uncharacterized protein n=1 Tax=Oxynema aestuarii AP17 TaxID=2064643 RepID=A0A6H1U146_9CYAN|nr:hypothetical protein [Oxynema aestuarii]QIZ71339.1 hypothetical protein HCG48_12715 [Oxynema aestuarii AP17]
MTANFAARLGKATRSPSICELRDRSLLEIGRRLDRILSSILQKTKSFPAIEIYNFRVVKVGRDRQQLRGAID